MKIGLHEGEGVVYRRPTRLWMARRRYCDPMRWSHLFDDLEAQMSRADREAFEAEVRERADAERATVTLASVLAASAGDAVKVTLVDGSRVDGVVADAAAQWLTIASGARETLVPQSAISVLEGPRSAAPEPGPVARRLSLGHALRALASDGTAVVINAHGATTRGRIVAVGADYVVLEEAAIRRAVPFAAILSVAAQVA
jgi:hypothetical protein